MNKKNFISSVVISASMLIGAGNVYAAGFADTINNLVYTLEGTVDMENTNQQDRFHQRMEEIPDEIGVVMPFEVEGEYQVFVSNDGSDDNDGTIDRPFKTLKKALKWVEKQNASVRKKGMVINLREGSYALSQELVMNGKHSGLYDSPLYITSYNNEDVTVTSSTAIPFRDFKPVTDEAIKRRLAPEIRDRIYEVNLKDYGIYDYGAYTSTHRKPTLSGDPVLFCENEKMIVSRYPNNSVLRVGERTDDPAAQLLIPAEQRTFEWRMADDRALKWETIEDTWVFAYFAYNYDPEVRQILEIDRENLTVKNPGERGSSGNLLFRNTAENTYYFFNVLEELDMEGEWYIDKKTGKMYIYPPSYADKDSVYYFSIGTNNVFSGNDVKNVVFNGIEFKNTAAKAISFTYSDYIVVQNCKFVNCSGGAVQLDCCTNSGVTTNYFRACPGNAIQMIQERYEDPYVYDLISRNNFIQNNFLEGGKDEDSKFYSRGNGVVISHNLNIDTTHGSYSGDGINWYLEYNESVGGDKLQNDGAPYYTAGSVGDVVVARYNYFHHPSQIPMYGRGIYFDEGSSHFMAYGNIVHGGHYGSFSHNGKFGSWFNNIFLENEKSAATSANYYSQYNKHRSRAFYTHESSWYCMANRYAIDPSVYNWIKIFPEHLPFFNKIYEYHEFLRNNPTAEMGEVETWLLEANYFYMANNLNLGGKHEIARTSASTIIEENNYEVTKEDFADYDNYDFTVINEELIKKMPGFKQIPLEKIGLIKDCDMWRDLKMGEFKQPMFPKKEYENRVSPSDISFEWLKVSGASFYNLIIAEDESFENVVYNEVLGQPYAIVDLEPEKHYFYKIIAQSKAKCLDYAEVESQVYDFYTMTIDEANKVSKAEKKDLRMALAKAQLICDQITEGENPGQYPSGTKLKLQAEINRVTAYMEKTNVQGYIDDALNEFNRAVFDVQKTVKTGKVLQLDVSAQKWEKVINPNTAGNQDKAIKLENDENGNLVLNTLMDRTVYVRNKEQIPYGSFATIRIKTDSLETWQLIAGLSFEKTAYGLSANDLYSIILSKDSAGKFSAEMQKYKLDVGQKEFLTVENTDFFKPGEWSDVAIGTIPTDNGTRFVVIANGKLIYDYLDSFENGCYFKESYFVANKNIENAQAEFAKSDMTYEQIMEIVNAG